MKWKLRACVAVALSAAVAVAVMRRGATAGEDRPHAVFEAEDPPPNRDGRVIVAVIDTGVDTTHPALKDACLPGINLAEPDQPAADLAGHGTAVAGLIAAVTKDESVTGTADSAARILPIKVTAGAERQTPPTFLAAGIDVALDAGAGVICIAMGSPRSTQALDEALERARKKGVLVIASAGISDGSADYWPAMHPWSVSCTVTEQREVELPDGSRAFVDVPASRAHISGKTELMGNGFAQSLAAGGGVAPLEGSSVVTARVAGYAAKLRRSRPDAGGAELRRMLVLSGAPVRLGNYSLNFPTRIVHPRLGGSAAGRSRDLCLEAFDTNPGPVEPGKPAKLEVLVTNLGDVEKAGDVVVAFPKLKIDLTHPVAALRPGETRRIEVDLPAIEAGSWGGTVTIRSEKDDNAANDTLPIKLNVQPAPDVAVLVKNLRVEKLQYGSRELVVVMEVQNCGLQEVAGHAGGAILESVSEQAVKLGPRETRTITTRLSIPDLNDQQMAVRPSLGFQIDGKPIHTIALTIKCVQVEAIVQYADAWATREIILDAPAFVVAGRATVPVLLFAPEVHTQIQTASAGTKVGRYPEVAPRGIWLHEVQIEDVPREAAIGRVITPGLPPATFPGAKSLFSVVGRTTAPLNADRVHRSAGVECETGVGMPLDPLDLVRFLNEDGWHAVLNIPIASLALPEEREAYLHAWVRHLDFALNPNDARWSDFDSSSAVAEAVLRVRLGASLPKLHEEGQYYDVHVHTASEFSRDAVEPRLSWGGPLWMLVRSAHAMGFVDEEYVRAVRRGSVAEIAAREVLFTTDHNCFLTDAHTPDALPYGKEAEFATIRRFAGRGAGQEVAMQDRNGRPTGAAHALVYGAAPMRGPWHGGRTWARGLGNAKAVLERIQKADLGNLADRTLPGILRRLRDHDVERAAVLDGVNEALRERGAPALTSDAFLKIVTVWGDLQRGQLEELVAMADRVVSGAIERPEANDNTVAFVEQQLAAHGAWIAAHPMAGSNLNWRVEDLDRAANLTRERFVEIEAAGRFPFVGVQAWNETPMIRVPLSDPAELRQLNFWSRAREGIGAGIYQDAQWHCEWMAGMLHYLNAMARPGLNTSFQPRERRRRLFIRKLYHYAGSDAHGSFNYTTGVGATLLTNPTLMPLLAAFGHQHGTSTHSSHFGSARVYAQKPAFEEVYRGRVVCTDGPLAWIELDGDLKFDGKALIWHESWDEPSRAQDVDGEIGGDGAFDGRRTALVRRDSDALVLRYRVADSGRLAPRIQRMDLYTLLANGERMGTEFAGDVAIRVPKPRTMWRPGEGQDWQYRALTPWSAASAGFLFAGGFSSWEEELDQRYSPLAKRCMTNPIWFSTVRIGATAEPAGLDGKAIVPPGKFVATFRADHAMFEAAPVVLLKQFNSEGDSVGATWRLKPTRSDADGFWKPEVRDDGEGEFEADDTVLVAVNEEPIVLGLPWYPREGVNTFALILSGAKDTHGNPLNAVAAKIEIEWPVAVVPLPDEVSLPDAVPGGGEGLATVTVRPGETIELPRGATRDGKKIPAGAWAVPGQIPAAGISLLVACGTQTATVLLVAGERETGPALSRVRGGGFVGNVPSPGQGPAQVSVANHTDRSVVVGEPAVVTARSCVFVAPELAPGACTATIRQGGGVGKHDLEAVAAILRWEGGTATVGEQRTLTLVLVGAARPAEWTVSGTLRVRKAEITQVEPGVTRRADGSLELTNLRGDAGRILTARAREVGEMEAEYELRAARTR